MVEGWCCDQTCAHPARLSAPSFMLFHGISVSLWAAVVVQRKSQRIWNRAHLRISHKLCCENSNVSSGSVQFYLTRCNADYSTCGASDNNTVIKKGVVSPSLTPPFRSKWDVFFFCSHHLVVPVITHLPLLWFIQQHFIISLWRWIVSCSCY